MAVCRKLTGLMRKIEREYGVEFLEQEGVGRCNARNSGISRSNGEIIAFIDDDVELPPGWFGLLTSYVDVSVGAVHEGKTDDKMSELSMLLKCLDEQKWIALSVERSQKLKTDKIIDVTPRII